MKENIKCTRLESGAVLLTDTMKEVRSATLGFFYRRGSRHEPLHLNGITHFIEHCVFKGSRRRSARDIAILQDRLGGSLDAFTTHEETGFVIKVVDDQMPTAFDLLSDMLLEPRFDDADLANEQNVIIEEIRMTEDSPEELLGDIFQREFFAGHPLGLAITGTPETLSSFDHPTTENFHRSAFDPSNLIIAAAGNLEHETLIDLVKKKDLQGVDQSRKHDLEPSPPMPSSPIFIENRPDLEQAHFILAFPCVDARDERRYAADLLANILGGGTSSRLWQKVREEKGLAYSIGASNAMYLDTGFLSVSGATSSGQLEDVIDIVIGEIASIKKVSISEDELSLMKDQARAAVLLDLEDSASRAGSLAQCELVHKRQIPVEENLANIEAVSLKDIETLADEIFRTERAAFVALGDLDGLRIDRDRVSVGT